MLDLVLNVQPVEQSRQNMFCVYTVYVFQYASGNVCIKV